MYSCYTWLCMAMKMKDGWKIVQSTERLSWLHYWEVCTYVYSVADHTRISTLCIKPVHYSTSKRRNTAVAEI